MCSNDNTCYCGFVGDIVNKMWFPIIVPVGVVGNALSFLVGKIIFPEKK